MGERLIDDVIALAAVGVIAVAAVKRPHCPRLRRLRSGTIAAVRLRRRR